MIVAVVTDVARTVVTDVAHKSALRALLSRKNHDRRAVLSEPSLNRRRSAEIEQSVSKFKIGTMIAAKRIKIQNRHNYSIR